MTRDVALIAAGTPSARPTALPTEVCGTGTEAAHRRAGPGGPTLRHRQGRRYNHQRPGVIWSSTPTKWSTDFLRTSRFRMGADQSPAGAHQWQPRANVKAAIWCLIRSICQASRADLADHGYLAEGGPVYEKIRGAYGEPGSVADAFARAVQN